MPNILLVTATKVESQTVLQRFEATTGLKAAPKNLDGHIYFDLGPVNGLRAFMIQSEMGAGGVGASLQTVTRGIEALEPMAVIMAGIAFGASEEWQAIGDILVAENLRLYEPQRVGADQVIARGDRPRAADRLLKRLKSADLLWEGARVHYGVVVTGEKLVDDLAFRGKVFAAEPEAIGGEMEGAGLYAACHDAKVDWVLVKGICDWADGNKEHERGPRQKKAALNAVDFVLHAITFVPFEAGAAEEPAVPQPTYSSLPPQPIFFGREKELAVIAEAILPESRTWGALIDGPGGMGKTSLAVRAAYLAPAKHYPRKVFLSAKARELTPRGEQKLEDFMLPNFIELLTAMAREMGDDGLAKLPENQRASAVSRLLADQRALFVIDNIETFAEPEQVRLYQFLSRLPHGCKAIVTSRRRSDVDARAIRLDRMEARDAFALLSEISKTNKLVAAATERERQTLYEFTGGNPLLLQWTAGQLGRQGSHCRTLTDAFAFLNNAPAGNDPLEYIFGDLLDTFTASETAVLAALTHFSQPARVEWIADLAGLAGRQAQTALEDLADRALLVGDPTSQSFQLPPLTARFLQNRRPEAVAKTGDRLAERVYALVLENGYDGYDRYPELEAEWPAIAAALPRLIQGDNGRLQKLCDALNTFLDFSGRWDERLALNQQAEDKAVQSKDLHNAGWRAYQCGWVQSLRGESANVLQAAARAEAYWEEANAGVYEWTSAIRIRGVGNESAGNNAEALSDYQQALQLQQGTASESALAGMLHSDIAAMQRKAGDYASAEASYREALRIARKNNASISIAVVTGNFAALALDQKKWPEAEHLSREALMLSEPLRRLELIGLDNARLARSLARQGRPSEGLPYARRALEIATTLKSPRLVEYATKVWQECESAE